MTRSISRIHASEKLSESQRGFVLVSALVIAALYFGLIELTLLDSSRRLETAQRFRARIAARILAENGAELAAQNMTKASSTSGEAELSDGIIQGRFERSGDTFVLRGSGSTSGVKRASAGIEIRGRIDGNVILIDSSRQLP